MLFISGCQKEQFGVTLQERDFESIIFRKKLNDLGLFNLEEV